MSKALPSGTKADIAVRSKKVANVFQEKFLSLPPSPPALKSKYKIQFGFKEYGRKVGGAAKRDRGRERHRGGEGEV